MTAERRILRALRKGPKRGLTARELEEGLELPITTVRNTLYRLLWGTPLLEVAGFVTREGSGRPARRYRAR